MVPTYKEMMALREKQAAERQELEKRIGEMRRKEWAEKGIVPLETESVKEKYCEHPNTPENGAATFFWAVGVVVSLLFKGGWVLCILITLIWLNFITRHIK